MNTGEGITVLSLFDGMSCGQIALQELGVKVKAYYASEIEPSAIKTTLLNFPDTIQLGDVRNVHGADLPKIDLLIGGSPCQGFSYCGKRLNFEDPRSVLFFEFVRVLEEVRKKNPDVLFLLENVKMGWRHEKVITQYLGVKPVRINSALVSAQNRVRLYWTNIRTFQADMFDVPESAIPQPKDRKLTLEDILEEEVEDRYFVSEKSLKSALRYNERMKESGNGFGVEVHTPASKSPCVTTKYRRRDLVIVQRGHGFNSGGVFECKSPTVTASSWQHNNYVAPAITISSENLKQLVGGVRRLTPTETARLQTVPDWYRFNVNETQIYKMLGNGWTVEVIKHIFSFIKTT